MKAFAKNICTRKRRVIPRNRCFLACWFPFQHHPTRERSSRLRTPSFCSSPPRGNLKAWQSFVQLSHVGYCLWAWGIVLWALSCKLQNRRDPRKPFYLGQRRLPPSWHTCLHQLCRKNRLDCTAKKSKEVSQPVSSAQTIHNFFTC